MRTVLRKLAIPLAFLVVALPAGIGTVMAMSDDETAERDSGFRPIAQDSARPDVRRAQARWERVMVLSGSGPARRTFAIADGAVQWKAEWSCSSGRMRMTVDGDRLVEGSCPDVGDEVSTAAGTHALEVSASGPWRVVVRQQVDTALEEPRLPEMTGASLVGRGRFHPIQKDGEGTVSVHRLRGGRLALRFQDFYTDASPGLRVWLSRARDPRSTLDARRARHIDVGAVRSTLGSYNHMLPADVATDDFRSIVIWCPTVTIAFSAAPLRSPP